MRNLRTLIIASTGAIALSAIAIVYLSTGTPNAEAAVTEACAAVESADSFNVATTLRGTNIDSGIPFAIILEMRFDGKLSHSIMRISLDGVVLDEYTEQYHDGENTRYYKSSNETEWSIDTDAAVNRGFPYSKESLCPDLSDAAITLIADETVDGVATRKYSYGPFEDDLFGWVFWIDSDGWLTQVESATSGLVEGREITGGQEGNEGPGFTARASLSVPDEPNTITMPVTLTIETK